MVDAATAIHAVAVYEDRKTRGLYLDFRGPANGREEGS